jgi:hypothetical protein
VWTSTVVYVYKKSVHSDNKGDVIKRNQYSEIQEIYGGKIQDNCHKEKEKQKSEKCNITTNHTAIY